MLVILQALHNLYVLMEKADNDRRAMLQRAINVLYHDLALTIINAENLIEKNKAELISLSSHQGTKQ